MSRALKLLMEFLKPFLAAAPRWRSLNLKAKSTLVKVVTPLTLDFSGLPKLKEINMKIEGHKYYRLNVSGK